MDEETKKIRREVEEMMDEEKNLCDGIDDEVCSKVACIYYRIEREDIGMKYHDVLLLCIDHLATYYDRLVD